AQAPAGTRMTPHKPDERTIAMKTRNAYVMLGVGFGALVALGGSAAAEPYIPVISKGFQHQFWQAVKLGAEKAAKELNVKITFEGPENESQVDKQMEMLQAALAKKPQAICFAALDSKAANPLLKKAQAAKIPV